MVPFRFEVTHNGKLLCVAGMDCDGVLMVTIEAENLQPASDGSSIRGTPGGRSQCLSIEGFTDTVQALKWPGARISEGDEIVIRVLPSGKFDSPTIVDLDDE